MHNSTAAVPSPSVEAAIPVPGLPVPPMPPGECVEFQGARQYGYGCLSHNGKWRRAHRVAWESVNGPVPDGMVLDHLCRNRACVNLNHLELVTQKTNCLRGLSGPAINARKTHCSRGHELNQINTYVTKTGRRMCRCCNRQRTKEYEIRARLAWLAWEAEAKGAAQ